MVVEAAEEEEEELGVEEEIAECFWGEEEEEVESRLEEEEDAFEPSFGVVGGVGGPPHPPLEVPADKLAVSEGAFKDVGEGS